MKNKKVIDILKSKNIIIPLYIYKLYPKFNIELDIFVFLMYLYSLGDKIIFDPKKIAEEFGISPKDVLIYIDSLNNANLISFEIIKNEKNISEEYLSLSLFLEKISMLMLEIEDNGDNKEKQSIFETIEKEFGRVLSPIEYEIIKAWIESDISDDLIKEALKEAVFNGVNNLRYIDKILYEWQKKGIKTIKDVENNRNKHKLKEEKIEVFEYNWLEDE